MQERPIIVLYTIRRTCLLLDVLVSALVSKSTRSCVVLLFWQSHLTTMVLVPTDYDLFEPALAQARNKLKHCYRMTMANHTEGSGRYQEYRF